MGLSPTVPRSQASAWPYSWIVASMVKRQRTFSHLACGSGNHHDHHKGRVRAPTAHYRRVARTRLTIKDFADPLVRVPGEGDTPCDLGIRQEET